jgi:hypothetical protein
VFVPDGLVRRFDAAVIPPDVATGTPASTLWDRVKGNLILPEDRRYAWVPLYRRWSSPPSPGVFPPIVRPNDFAEVTIFVVRVRNHSEYGNADLAENNNKATLIPTPVTVELREGFGAPDRVIVKETDHPVVTGTYLVIAGGADKSGRNAAGRIYRVGNPIAEGNRNEYELAPGNDMLALAGPDGNLNTSDDLVEDTPSSSGLPAWCIGEGVAPGGTNFFGGAQDVGIYTTFIKLNP